MHINEDIQLIRQQSALRKIIQEEPETEARPNQEYDERDIARELRNLVNRKEHGNDGIPVEAYKATRKLATKPITRIASAIKTVQNTRMLDPRNHNIHIQKQMRPERMRKLQTYLPNANHI